MEINITIKIDDEEIRNLLNVDTPEEKDVKAFSPYARIIERYENFRSCCTACDAHFYVRLMQGYANQRLQERGYLYLNEVYELFSIPKVEYGYKVGWFYDEKNPIGDNFVDFNLDDEINEDFINGNNNAILVLDFNVDGDISERVFEYLIKQMCEKS